MVKIALTIKFHKYFAHLTVYIYVYVNVRKCVYLDMQAVAKTGSVQKSQIFIDKQWQRLVNIIRHCNWDVALD